MNDLEIINNTILDKLKQERLLPRGQRLVGIVISNKAKNTVVVAREVIRKLPKYNRYMRSKSKIHVHVPNGIELKIGDTIEIAETRKISKTKSWVVNKILKRGEEG